MNLPAGQATAQYVGAQSVTQTPRESQTSSQFQRLKEGTAYLQDRLNLLQLRLEPLLRSIPANPESTAGLQPKEQLVAHAQVLANFADSLDQANRGLDDVLSRLEL